MIANKNGGRRKKVFEYCIPKNTLIIFDESHKLKGKTSLNSKLGIFAKEQGYKILMASATIRINFQLICEQWVIFLDYTTFELFSFGLFFLFFNINDSVILSIYIF